jgi:hypothetical protein
MGNEAERRNRKNSVELRVSEWRRLGLPLDEPQLNILDHGPPSRGGDHYRVRVKASYDGATPGKFRRKGAIAATDIK